MLHQILNWLRSLWTDTIEPAAIETVNEEYRTYLSDKYGITKVYVDEPEVGEKHWRE